MSPTLSLATAGQTTEFVRRLVGDVETLLVFSTLMFSLSLGNLVAVSAIESEFSFSATLAAAVVTSIGVVSLASVLSATLLLDAVVWLGTMAPLWAAISIVRHLAIVEV